MCVPVLDEIVDGAMTFVLPIVSTIGSLSTMGLLDHAAAAAAAHAAAATTSSDYYNGDGDDEDRARRLTMASNALWFFKFLVIFIGIGLAFGLHLFKMLVRLIGEGWLTNILTVVEASWVLTTVLLAIFVKQIAILIAVFIAMAASYILKKKFWNKQETALIAQELTTATTTTVIVQQTEIESGNYTPPVQAATIAQGKN